MTGILLVPYKPQSKLSYSIYELRESTPVIFKKEVIGILP